MTRAPRRRASASRPRAGVSHSMHDVHRAYPSTTPSARSDRRFIPVPSVLFHEFIADGSKLARRHRLVTLVGEIVHARAVYVSLVVPRNTAIAPAAESRQKSMRSRSSMTSRVMSTRTRGRSSSSFSRIVSGMTSHHDARAREGDAMRRAFEVDAFEGDDEERVGVARASSEGG